MIALAKWTTFALHITFISFEWAMSWQKTPEMKLSNLMNFSIQKKKNTTAKVLHRNCLLAPEPIILHHKQMLLQYNMEQLSANTILNSYKEWNY